MYMTMNMCLKVELSSITAALHIPKDRIISDIHIFARGIASMKVVGDKIVNWVRSLFNCVFT